MLLRMGLLLRLGPNVITDGTFITLGSNYYTCAFYRPPVPPDLYSTQEGHPSWFPLVPSDYGIWAPPPETFWSGLLSRVATYPQYHSILSPLREGFFLGTLTPRFIVRPENREHLKYFRNVYCVMTNHSKDQHTRTKPQNKKLISVLSFLTPDWLFSCNTIIFQKYFYCSRFSRFDCKRFPATRILPITFSCVFCSLSGVEPLCKTTADWKSLLIQRLS